MSINELKNYRINKFQLNNLNTIELIIKSFINKY